ncbi:hypothetical protein [Jejuia pallidilutea]|jgi:hypothetical protein|uniref:DUF4397 domain-containing protein n=1 Tax=Jejuia pallidilutea TaxID=504487 RepID=A0A090W8E3_9FLAO|nr:hypothetical protein [Jejuia pallidilutea]GAL68111.1 hypothetical protein JCM19301_1208 [Jejuia pallidilutea]GAL71739.1 hypothetical protein JCM19302_1889 [Jejuia pallidilutea]GAL91105.1 hypothetical protein JCM19538_2719 [Jejuia pallidilutea]
MKKIALLALGLSFIIACSNDDDTTEPPIQSFDYNENLSGDLSNLNTAPDVLVFVGGQNTITASQSSNDVDYFTFTVPDGYELSQIVVDDYESSDDAGFIGIVNGSTFPTDAATTNASDLLGGLVYGVPNRGNNILPNMGTLNGAQGFTGALPAGAYSIWLNQTGATSETALNFIIVKQ